MTATHFPLVCAVVLMGATTAAAADLDRPPIAYSTAPADNVVTALRDKLRKGAAAL